MVPGSNDDIILVSPCRVERRKGILTLDSKGINFISRQSGRQKEYRIDLKFENLVSVSIEGSLRKKLVVTARGSPPESHYFSVYEPDTWKDHIAIAAKIYRSFTGAGMKRTVPPVAKPPAGTPPPAKNVHAQPTRVTAPPPVVQPQQARGKPPPPVKPAAPKQVQKPPPGPAASRGTGEPWPSGQDYEQCFQSVKYSLHKSLGDIANGTAVKNPKSPVWYVYASGNYGAVYKMKTPSSFYALKCFTRKTPNLSWRYQKISDYMGKVRKKLDFLVDFQYYEKGIRTMKDPSRYYPVLKMAWIDGVGLNRFVTENISKPKIIRSLADEFLENQIYLRKAGMAHGDLAGDNLIIDSSGRLRLIDYDGAFIPDFSGKASTELGHADFQHPSRSSSDYSQETDNFSVLVIYLSLIAVSEEPALWDIFNNDDPDCLLFRKSDFKDPGNSKVIGHLERNGGRRVKELTYLLVDSIAEDPLWKGCSAPQIRSVR